MAAVVETTSTEMKNNFGHFLSIVIDGQQVIITKNGKKVARVIPEQAAITSITDSLTGILKGSYDPDEEKEKALREKYETID